MGEPADLAIFGQIGKRKAEPKGTPLGHHLCSGQSQGGFPGHRRPCLWMDTGTLLPLPEWLSAGRIRGQRDGQAGGSLADVSWRGLLTCSRSASAPCTQGPGPASEPAWHCVARPFLEEPKTKASESSLSEMSHPQGPPITGRLWKERSWEWLGMGGREIQPPMSPLCHCRRLFGSSTEMLPVQEVQTHLPPFHRGTGSSPHCSVSNPIPC